MTTTGPAGPAAPPRQRYRAQVRQEVMDAALRQLAGGGPSAISLNAVARELGVSGPALYRYFSSRDELLTELVLDAYADLHAATVRAATTAGDLPPAERLRAVVRAVRAFALAGPHRYGLLFAAPVPGYDAHDQRLATAAHATLLVLLDVITAVDRPDDPPLPNDLAAQLRAWTSARDAAPVEPRHAAQALATWSRVHGLVSLEIGGALAALGVDAAALLEREVDALLPPARR